MVPSVSQLNTLPHRIVHLYFQLFYIQIQTNLHRKFFDLTQNKYSIMIYRFAKFELKRPSWSHSTVRFSADKLTLLTKTKTITNRRWPDLIMFGQKKLSISCKSGIFWKIFFSFQYFCLNKSGHLEKHCLSCVNCQNVKLFVT